MSKNCPRICANCGNWNCFEVDFEHPEDEVGGCKANSGDIVYGDDEACEKFKQMKRPRVRAERW